MKKAGIAAALLFALGGLSPADASSIDRLKEFIRHTTTGKAQFNQELLDKNGRSVQKSNGTMEFSRPGKFRWSYQKPYAQLIVGDGEKLWVYDPELNQVTVKKLDQALGQSPAALLAGSNEIEKEFNLKDDGTQNGLEWLQALPKTEDASFESIRMGFDKSGLQVMELRDRFGQTTILHFSELELNPRLSPKLFEFTPPKGADIVGE
ncbi:MAG TPA: outer membrane lipoprotein chaperone LolA [Burkholderiales bacterium]|nr:outer membrane lipoprotein chaperone LolA [Burkholderiales bacterium]